MGHRTEHVVDGHFVEVENRRTEEEGLYVECRVYSGPHKRLGEEPVGDWVMPYTLRYDHRGAARLAAEQTRFIE